MSTDKKYLDLQERVTVWATEKNTKVATGTEMKMGKLVAEKAIKDGYVTDEAPGKSPAKTKKAE